MGKRYESATPGLNAILRDLRKLPKEAQAELRAASQDIANRWMVPAWQAAARAGAGPWGDAIAASVKARRDRVPVVVIGGRRAAVSGGASPTMLRYPSHRGPDSRSGVSGRMPAAFTRTEWMDQVQPAYIGPAMGEWAAAVSRICRDFHNGTV